MVKVPDLNIFNVSAIINYKGVYLRVFYRIYSKEFLDIILNVFKEDSLKNTIYPSDEHKKQFYSKIKSLRLLSSLNVIDLPYSEKTLIEDFNDITSITFEEFRREDDC